MPSPPVQYFSSDLAHQPCSKEQKEGGGVGERMSGAVTPQHRAVTLAELWSWPRTCIAMGGSRDQNLAVSGKAPETALPCSLCYASICTITKESQQLSGLTSQPKGHDSWDKFKASQTWKGSRALCYRRHLAAQWHSLACGWQQQYCTQLGCFTRQNFGQLQQVPALASGGSCFVALTCDDPKCIPGDSMVYLPSPSHT